MQEEPISDLIVTKNEVVLETETEDGTIHINTFENELYEMSESALAIWRAIDGQRTVSEIISKICEDYDISPEDTSEDSSQEGANYSADGDTAGEQIMSLIQHFHEKGMVFYTKSDE